MSEWISVKDRLPVANDEYLVWPIPNRDMNIVTAVFQPWDSKWTQDCYNGYDYEYFVTRVTHWAEMLSPPTDEEG